VNGSVSVFYGPAGRLVSGRGLPVRFSQACRQAEADRLGPSQERLALHQTEDCNGRRIQACIMGSMAGVVLASGKGSHPV